MKPIEVEFDDSSLIPQPLTFRRRPPSPDPWPDRPKLGPRASPEDLEIELCDICYEINWHPILLNCCRDELWEQHKFAYRWANIPTFRQMHARQLSCSFCRLCCAAILESCPSFQDVDLPLQVVYYARNLKHEGPPRYSAKDVYRREHIRRAESPGFRLFVQPRQLGSWILHVNAGYAPSPIFQLMPAAEEVPLHRKRRCGQRVPATEADPTLFKRWVDRCRSKHRGTCDVADSGLRKTPRWQLAESLGAKCRFRLIDVQNRRIVDAPKGCSYVALSYVWGQVPGVYRTRKSDLKFAPGDNNSNATYLDIPDQGVPKTIQDAMRVTAMLGERFLWVDALCIVQDDAEELPATLKAMDIIYKAAIVTIVAASGTDAAAGLPGALPQSRKTNQLSQRVCGVTMFVEAPPLSDTLAASCWRSRAWTYQEELFSCRRMIFSDDYVYFQCQADEVCEDIVDEDENVQSYFIESGSMSAIWLRGRDRSPSEEICEYNANSRFQFDSDVSSATDEIEGETASLNDDQVSIPDTKMLDVEEDERVPAAEDPYTSLEGSSGSDSETRSNSEPAGPDLDPPSSHDWMTVYRSWLEMHQHSLDAKRPASSTSSNSLGSVTPSDFEVALDNEDCSSRRKAPQRRYSISDFTSQTRKGRETPSGQPRSVPRSSSATEIIEKEGKYQFRFTVPRNVDPFSRQSKSLVGKWLTRKSSIDRSRLWRRHIASDETEDETGNKNTPPNPDQMFREYAATVEGFTPRSLTKQADILNAYQGIMNHFEARMGGAGFKYGLPLAAFDAALLWKDGRDWDFRRSDWSNEWHVAGNSRGYTYTHHPEQREWYGRGLREQLGNSFVRSSEIYEDCDEFPTWSWCGWKGPVSYFLDGDVVSGLKAEITWPWEQEYTPPPNPVGLKEQRDSVLHVEAWIAAIDLTALRALKVPDTFWGWSVENGQKIRDGVVECLLLSTGLSGPDMGGREESPALFCNIMIIGRDGGGDTVYRRGIAQLYIEDWERFGPRKEWILLK